MGTYLIQEVTGSILFSRSLETGIDTACWDTIMSRLFSSQQ